MPGRILIVDDIATNRIVLKVTLASACYDVLQAGSGAEALSLAKAEHPDLILLDVLMPDINGISVCKQLKADPLTANIPILMVTSLKDSKARIRALEAGADDFLSKPIDEMTLLARVRSLLRARDTEEELQSREATCREFGFAEKGQDFTSPAKIALVASNEAIAVDWKSELSPFLDDDIEVVSKEDALALKGNQTPPDIFVISGDLKRPDEGLRLLSELRSRALTRHAAIIMVLRAKARQQAVIALDLGANDLMSGTFEPLELALRIRTQARRKRKADRLRGTVRDGLRMAVVDPLTGLYNRRYAFSHLERIAERAQTSGKPYAVMMLDIDRFKGVNDNFGHATGDAVLIAVAQRLRDNLRHVDLLARIGGEEFLIAMPDTNLADARFAAERLRRVVRDVSVDIPMSQNKVSVTLSIGVAISSALSTEQETAEQLIKRADRALFASKSEGRNQVTLSRSAA